MGQSNSCFLATRTERPIQKYRRAELLQLLPQSHKTETKALGCMPARAVWLLLKLADTHQPMLGLDFINFCFHKVTKSALTNNFRLQIPKPT